MKTLHVIAVLMLPALSSAATITVSDRDGNPLPATMVTRTIPGADIADTSDNGYPRPGTKNRAIPQHTRFTNADGVVVFDPLDVEGERSFRVRRQGYSDAAVEATGDSANIDVVLEELTSDEAIADSKPANLWLSELHIDYAENPAQTREHFLRHCGF